MAVTEELKLPLCQENIIEPLVSLSSIMDSNILSSITRIFAELSEVESNANKLVSFGVLKRECFVAKLLLSFLIFFVCEILTISFTLYNCVSSDLLYSSRFCIQQGQAGGRTVHC